MLQYQHTGITVVVAQHQVRCTQHVYRWQSDGYEPVAEGKSAIANQSQMKLSQAVVCYPSGTQSYRPTSDTANACRAVLSSVTVETGSYWPLLLQADLVRSTGRGRLSFHSFRNEVLPDSARIPIAADRLHIGGMPNANIDKIELQKQGSNIIADNQMQVN